MHPLTSPPCQGTVLLPVLCVCKIADGELGQSSVLHQDIVDVQDTDASQACARLDPRRSWVQFKEQWERGGEQELRADEMVTPGSTKAGGLCSLLQGVCSDASI